MIKRRRFCLAAFSIVIIGCIVPKVVAMVEDNRFFPEFPRNYSRTCQCPSAAFFDGQIMVGNDAFDQEDTDRDIGIFDVFGAFNEDTLANAIVAVGLPDPYDQFPTLARFRGQQIIWNMHGKIQTQGIAFQWDQHVWSYWGIGASCFSCIFIRAMILSYRQKLLKVCKRLVLR